MAALLAHSADRGATEALAGSGGLQQRFKPGTVIGATAVQLGGSFAAYAIGRATGNSRVAAIGADLFRAQMVAQAVTQAVKVSVGRTRPDGTPRSFPSGHASLSFASATVLERHLGWKAGIPAYAVASYVAVSRIGQRRHYLSDVAFGAALGIMAGRTVTIGRGDHRFAVAPTAASGGGGVSFTLLARE
jgi:membrane-associated phospholipid phosphatase